MEKLPDKLPDKPSEVIRIALEDMKLSIKNGIDICMDSWSSISEGKVCSVCMGGAVMLNTLMLNFLEVDKEDLSFEEDLSFFPMSQDDKRKILFLDRVRDGYIEDSLHLFYEKKFPFNSKYIEFKNVRHVDWIQYSKENEDKFFDQIEEVINLFESMNM